MPRPDIPLSTLSQLHPDSADPRAIAPGRSVRFDKAPAVPGASTASNEWFSGAQDAIDMIEALKAGLNHRAVTTGQLFSFMDADRDDLITFGEFKRGVAMSGVRPVPNDEALRILYQSFDANADGKISYQEMVETLEKEHVAVPVTAPIEDIHHTHHVLGEESLPADDDGTYVYDGNWKDTCRHGDGNCAWANGDKFFGTWFMDEMQQGCWECGADGAVFEGKFRNGKKFRGKWENYRYPNGDLYTGEWLSGLERSDTTTFHEVTEFGRRHGEGECFFANGDVFVGTWRDDHMVDGTIEFAHDGSCLDKSECLRKQVNECGKSLEDMGREWKDVLEKEFLEKVVLLRDQLHHKCATLGTLFHNMDEDRSDDITYPEFKRGLAMSGIRPLPSEQDQKALFCSFDVDKNGTISFQELQSRLQLDDSKQQEVRHVIADTVLQRYGEGDRKEVVFKGKFSGGLLSSGVITYTDGSYFKGSFRENRPCTGRWRSLIYEDRKLQVPCEFTGEWKECHKAGLGKLGRGDGATFKGVFKQDEAWEGIWQSLPLLDGLYTGRWNYGVRSGVGRLVYSNGDVYDGEWDIDLRHGEGTMVYADGSEFRGEWKEGKATHGEYKNYQTSDQYGSQGVYNGKVRYGQLNGEGTLDYAPNEMSPEGGTFEGEFKEDKTWDGQWTEYAKDGSGVYTGPVRSGLRHGFGTCRYANGDHYEGEWTKGVRHGNGRCKYADGTVFSGKWAGDKTRGVVKGPGRQFSKASDGQWMKANTKRITLGKQS